MTLPNLILTAAFNVACDLGKSTVRFCSQVIGLHYEFERMEKEGRAK